MRWGKTFDKSFGWHWWFAWKPVRMTDGRWCWMEGVSRVRNPQPLQHHQVGGKTKIIYYAYRCWEDHVRAKLEGTDPQRPSADNPLGMSQAAQAQQVVSQGRP